MRTSIRIKQLESESLLPGGEKERTLSRSRLRRRRRRRRVGQRFIDGSRCHGYQRERSTPLEVQQLLRRVHDRAERTSQKREPKGIEGLERNGSHFACVTSTSDYCVNDSQRRE